MNTLNGINLTPLQLRNWILNQDTSLVNGLKDIRSQRILSLIQNEFNVQIGITRFVGLKYFIMGDFNENSRFIEISWSESEHFRALRPRSH